MQPVTFAVVALVAGSATVDPASLLVADDVPTGFELVVDPPTDLAFAEYAELSPDATAHVRADGDAARSMRAAVDVWTSTDDDVLLREVTRWPSAADARAFVEQAVVAGVQAGLDRTEPPIDGGVAHQGADQGLWTRTVAWQQGPYAMSVDHFAVFEGSDAIIDEAVTLLATRVEAQTGQPVAAAPDSGPESSTTTDDGSGGITIGTVLLWVVVVGGVTWLIMRLRRRAAGGERRPSDGDRGDDRPERGERTGHRDRPDDSVDVDVDDVVERARARSRAEREIEAIPDPTDPGWRPPGTD